MPTFDLAVRTLDPEDRIRTLVPIVDGTSFVDLVAEFETAAGHDVAGEYDGIVPAHYRFGPLDQYYLGRSDTGWGGDGRIAVLGCGCGEVGCWPGCVTVTVTPTTVSWSSFEQPFRPTRDYAGFGPFEFDREPYEAAVRRAIDALASDPA